MTTTNSIRPIQQTSLRHFNADHRQNVGALRRLSTHAFPALLIIGYYIFTLAPGKLIHGVDFVFISKIFMLSAALIAIATRRLISTNVAFLIVVIVSLLFSAIFTKNTSFSWQIWAASATNLIAPLLLFSISYKEKDKTFLLKWISLAPIISLAVGVGYEAIGLSSLFGAGPRLQGTLIASFYAGVCLNGTLAALGRTVHDKKFVILAAFNLLLLLLTAARMPIFIAGIISIYIFYTQVRMNLSLKVAITAFAVLGMSLFLIVFGDALLSRFESGDSGRSVLWSHYLQLYQLYPEFGYGLGQSSETVPRSISVKSGFIVAAHNEYIRLLCEVGTACTFIVFAVLAASFMNASRISHHRMLFSFIVMSLVLAFCYTDNVFLSPVYYPIMIVALCFPHIYSRAQNGSRHRGL